MKMVHIGYSSYKRSESVKALRVMW